MSIVVEYCYMYEYLGASVACVEKVGLARLGKRRQQCLAPFMSPFVHCIQVLVLINSMYMYVLVLSAEPRCDDRLPNRHDGVPLMHSAYFGTLQPASLHIADQAINMCSLGLRVQG